MDEANITRLLSEYKEAGLGGVEITCIYGVQGNAAKNLEYRSDAWLSAVEHAIREANRLGMGVDLPAGSGWRMGGPSVTPEFANSQVAIETAKVAGGDRFLKRFDRAEPQAAIARSRAGQQIDVSGKLLDGTLEWTAPEGDWSVYTLAYRWAGDRVKRPGPGGAGLNINPFSERSVLYFLDSFGHTLKKLPGIRCAVPRFVRVWRRLAATIPRSICLPPWISAGATLAGSSRRWARRPGWTRKVRLPRDYF